jgi:putative restriction endonuclease
MAIGEADRRIRLAVFDWLTEQRLEHGEALARELLARFEIGGVQIPLVGPSGIWKPAACELPISVATIINGPYPDDFDPHSGVLRYAYRGTDPNHRDNLGLRRAMQERVPIVYFYGVGRGSYAAAYPVFVVGDEPTNLRFSMQLDDPGIALDSARGQSRVGEDPEPRRAYVTATFRRRLHQVAFRERVVRAYQDSCALCRLRHRELLDAAHITPDRDAEGDPVVSNGIALCKLHHAAFDGFFFAIRPDYVIEVSERILRETDGPMLVVGLQQIHGQLIHLPRRASDRPDQRRLERRYEEFRSSSESRASAASG